MRGQKNIFHNIDWITVFLYLTLVFLGWINIYAAIYDESHKSIFDISQRYGKQLIWIAAAIILALIILIIDAKFFSTFAYPIYIISILSLLAVLLLGTRIAGSKSWFQIGAFGIQPAEFAKFATNLAIAKYLTTLNINLKKLKTIIKSLLIIGIPAILILLQHDMGSALVYSSFILVLYREGLSGSILILGVMIVVLFILTLILGKFIFIGILAGIAFLMFFFIKRNRKNIYSIIGILVLTIAFVFSVDYGFKNVLKPHQKKRIEVLLGKEVDLKGAGYNVNQSKIAIGSGGFSGKGFLKGTQTKYNFVPEQSTDFIFCTVGEEWGFVGSFVVIFLFIALLIRLIKLAERQRSDFSRIYGYGVASILFFHIVVNIGMTIGLTPVIGIPLPFFSYGGSSLWAFTILLFIFLKQDANRLEVL
ncbi:MAG: rod shape-determining protein RodA [Bacteroidetes bacterium]|nr:rod shape-determining protein RodA [Bacteroidota bacterium]MCK4361617.1 rod shape-determining protein RodA [Bacteroidales bacterium]